MQQWYQCPKCGATVAFGQRFCENCGAQLSYPPQQQPPPSQYQQQPPTQPYYQQQPSYKQEAPKLRKKGSSPGVIFGVLLALLVVAGGIFAVLRMDLGSSSLPSLPFLGQGSSDTIELPWGSTIKVVFNGPPELDVEWEKLGMADALGSQLHVIGNVKNVSSQSVRFSDINYYLDGYQVAFTNYGPEGQTLYPGETIEIMKGITGFTENTKVLEVRIIGFQKTGETASQTTASTNGSASTPTYQAQPLDNGVIMGDFSVALIQVERITGETRQLNALINKDDFTRLHFAIRRVNATTDDGASLAALDKIQIIDDHENKYSDDGFSRLAWRRYIANCGLNKIYFSHVPVGFTWIETYDVTMPIAAPIKKIQLLTGYPHTKELKWDIDYSKYKPSSPNLNTDIGAALVSIGESVSYDKYMKWKVGPVKRVNCTLQYEDIQEELLIPFEVENSDYTSKKISLFIVVQERDGNIRNTIYYLGGYFFNSPEDNPYRPAYSVSPQYIYRDIPGQSNVSLRYYRVPIFPGQPEDMPVKLLIFNHTEQGQKRFYVVNISQ